MKKRLFLLAVAVFYVAAIATFAWAQSGGSPSNPIYQRRLQGNYRSQFSVTCADSTAVMSGTDYDNVLSIYCQNMETTAANRIGICPRAASDSSCNATTEYAARLDGGQAWTTDMSAGGDWSCDGVGGSYILNCYVEQWYKIQPGQPTPAVPTPLATSSPTPTPTPTP